MKPKHLIILAGVLVFLAAGIVFKKFQPRPELTTQEYAPLDLAFDATRVAHITLSKQTSGEAEIQAELVKGADGWKIPALWQADADEKKTTEFLNEIQKAKGELRGKSREIFKDFGIADGQGQQVTLADANGEELLTFILGSRKTDYGMSFIRRKNSEAVYLSEADFYSRMGVFGDPAAEKASADFWASKQYAFFDPARIRKIEKWQPSKGAAAAMTLEKENGVWKFSGSTMPFPPGTEKVEQFLTALKSASAQKILDPHAKDYGLAKPRLRLILTPDSGSSVEIIAGDPESKDENAFYLQSSGQTAVFLVSKYDIETLQKSEDDFVGNNPLGIDHTKIEKLVIRADKIEKVFYPAVKKWDALVSYLDGLKEFPIQSAVSGKPRFGKYWIEIHKQGEQEPLILDVSANPISDGDVKKYPVKKRGAEALLSVPAAFFSRLFDNLSRLDEPKS